MMLRSLPRVVWFAAFLFSQPLAAQSGVIYQAFNQPFEEIRRDLNRLHRLGFTYIQVSPPQKSIDNEIWWGRYQPVDLQVIDGPLGTERQLKSLIDDAHAQGLKILIDIVLNHMADPVFYPGGLDYPQFGPEHFHFVDERPCIHDWDSRTQVTTFWLCDPHYPERRLPDLDTSQPYVRQQHLAFLRKFVDLGADGFRLDAAKHIEPEYFQWLLPRLPDHLFIYGEVIGRSLYESNLYTPIMLVSDFHLLSTMISQFSLDGSLAQLRYPESSGGALAGDRAVVFARNHDTAMHSGFFNFATIRDANLANAYLLARGVGVPVIYRDDASSHLVRYGVRFYNHLLGKGNYIRSAGEICAGQAGCSDQVLLAIERENDGIAFLNKANEELDFPAAQLPGLGNGCFRELRHDFNMQTSVNSSGETWVSAWGSHHRGGLKIGPRDALYFIRVPSHECG